MAEAQKQQRVLAIGAHPDDTEVGCGGTVAKLAQQGWEITYIVCTNGNKGSHDPSMDIYRLSALREQEQQAAAAALGVQRVIFLRYNDGELEPTPALRLELALYVRHFKPHAVYTHDPWRRYMLHPDHRAVGFAVIEGLVSARDHLYLPGLEQIGYPVWRPEYLYLWSADDPDYTEDIGATLELKLEALAQHHSQIEAGSTFVERMRQRSLDQGQSAGFAAGEAFRRIRL
ncbi:MAG: PIG-L family deacetylase [Chloroflexaceae bacterium]|nr:PIG-L family deacetylase [Chloroflexaceae bacterium]